MKKTSMTRETLEAMRLERLEDLFAAYFGAAELRNIEGREAMIARLLGSSPAPAAPASPAAPAPESSPIVPEIEPEIESEIKKHVAPAIPAPAGDLAARALIMARIAGLPGLDPLAAEADTLVQLLSGRPQFLMPLRVRVR